MELSWRDFVKLHAPYIAYALLVVIGAIYAYGYRQGMAAMIRASADAAREATCGV
jgi:hypothetical protein